MYDLSMFWLVLKSSWWCWCLGFTWLHNPVPTIAPIRDDQMSLKMYAVIDIDLDRWPTMFWRKKTLHSRRRCVVAILGDSTSKTFHPSPDSNPRPHFDLKHHRHPHILPPKALGIFPIIPHQKSRPSLLQSSYLILPKEKPKKDAIPYSSRDGLQVGQQSPSSDSTTRCSLLPLAARSLTPHTGAYRMYLVGPIPPRH